MTTIQRQFKKMNVESVRDKNRGNLFSHWFSPFNAFVFDPSIQEPNIYEDGVKKQRIQIPVKHRCTNKIKVDRRRQKAEVQGRWFVNLAAYQAPLGFLNLKMAFRGEAIFKTSKLQVHGKFRMFQNMRLRLCLLMIFFFFWNIMTY